MFYTHSVFQNMSALSVYQVDTDNFNKDVIYRVDSTVNIMDINLLK